jgi:hypothetical protein
VAPRWRRGQLPSPVLLKLYSQGSDFAETVDATGRQKQTARGFVSIWGVRAGSRSSPRRTPPGNAATTSRSSPPIGTFAFNAASVPAGAALLRFRGSEPAGRAEVSDVTDR